MVIAAIILYLIIGAWIMICAERVSRQRQKMTIQDATLHTREITAGKGYNARYREDQMSFYQHLWLLVTFRNAVNRYRPL